ncbi:MULTISPECIES: L-2-amino-thiazoline-4-carboxylic acid hydrolase [unclassified Capnocytophaga]|jgi:hypothetical protein|uniref:L-2-amino-thiazoline-4-carboxylic acid hydrolase n=1 Tax=unclassified Capnocytophaga TaxID=2640652 RepID=UPI000202F483|nr:MULTISPECIES: L-2-amino-thiazoline-4-carboxylic acid hydrolase [unclassified Capnocytophaga]EGD35382.1 hypothetical protein HMPREF9071_0051 [Capnocytophaga sp. oral taxon 338 str. F0234]MEB3005886.1 L-2-amino-thiazoline-4-carboxylic acid hydrolase [Capnocytophaga sp. G2]
MNQEEQYRFRPLDAYQWIKDKALVYIRTKQWIDASQFEEFLIVFESNFVVSLEKVAPLICNELDKGNVQFAVLTVALYEAFIEFHYSEKEAFHYVCIAVNEPIAPFMEQNTEAFLTASEDPFETIVQISKTREQNYFGKSFTFVHRIDDAFGYVLQIKSCLFHEVLKVLGYPFLQSIICQIDCGWIKGIKSDKHGLQFVRPTTFATGTTCQMWFIKKEPTPKIAKNIDDLM